MTGEKRRGRPRKAVAEVTPALRDAIKFARSLRGQYIIGQALFIAAERLTDPSRKAWEREPSNAEDMRYLMENIPGWNIYGAMHSPEVQALINDALQVFTLHKEESGERA